MAAKSIGKRSTEGLAGLVSSLNAAGAVSNGASNESGGQDNSQGIIGPGTNVSPEAMERLAQRLKELMGDFAAPGQEHLPVNEDGLPIMEFNEHLPAGTIEEDTIVRPGHLSLKPLISMTPEERAERRRQRDAFLDMLEEEERQEELREDMAQEQKGTIIQNLRRDTKKLQEEEGGKALLDRAPGERVASPSEENANPTPVLATKVANVEDMRLKAETNWKASDKSGVGKGKGKSVSFVGVEEGEKDEDSAEGPKPLRGSRRPTMKSEIVERMPPRLPSTSSSSTQSLKLKGDVKLVTGPDSDDESNGSDQGQPLGEDAEDNEVDMDEALHQREIALRYYQLRQKLDIGSKEDEWDRPEVPLNATLAAQNKRSASSTSRFMGPRISDKAMAAVVPQGIESKIKPAKVVDGQLTEAGGNESDEGISGAGKQVIEDLARSVPAGETAQHWGTAAPSQGRMGSQPTFAKQQAEGMAAGPAIPIVVPATRESPVLTEVREAGERVPKWQPKAANGTERVSRFKANRTARGE